MSVAPTPCCAASPIHRADRSLTAMHHTWMAEVVDLVVTHGADRANELLDGRGVPAAAGRPHRTLAAYATWAVSRLLDGGVDPVRIPWHPLVDLRSPLAWYDAETLSSIEAHVAFVPPTLALPHEPQPNLPLGGPVVRQPSSR